MILWIDAQLSPSLAAWIRHAFGIDAQAVRDVGLRDAKDTEIFMAARNAGATVMTKDGDFVSLLERYGSPPQILWVTCGNTSNLYLRALLERVMPTTLRMLEQGESIVEIGDTR